MNKAPTDTTFPPAFRLTLVCFLALLLVSCTSNDSVEYVEELIYVTGARSALSDAVYSPTPVVLNPAVPSQGDDFEKFEENPVVKVSEQPVSTFSADATRRLIATRVCS